MVELPWRGRSESGGDDPERDADGDARAGAVVVCTFQDGTLVVYEDRVVVERVARSRFDDVTLPFEEIRGVDYAGGITIGYLQLEVVGVDPDTGGLLSDPVNERTLHFGRADRDCAKRARDAILERASG